MKRGLFFFLIIPGVVLGLISVSRAQTESGFAQGREAGYHRDAKQSVNVYGPERLIDLAGQAIQERRRDVVIVEHYKSLRHKVWIEGTTGSGYMPLSPKRVRLMEAARNHGRSVYSALCSDQQKVIERTVGITRVYHPVVREYRVEKRYYVQPVYVEPPPPPVYVYPAVYGFGGFYPAYSYRSYGGWSGRYYGGWGGYRYYHGGYGGHYPGAFHRGHR
ncbi:MAG: hypothetical protein ACP5SH_00600 [Syntrophobacteraceae bacterium]